MDKRRKAGSGPIPDESDEPAAQALRRQAANFNQADVDGQTGTQPKKSGGVRDDAESARSPGRRPGADRNLDPDPDGDRTGRSGDDPLAR